MAHKDPELSRLEAERAKAELAALTEKVKFLMRRVPDKVNNGSVNMAMAFKHAAEKGHRLITGKRISLKDAKECVAELERFFTNDH